MPDVGLLCVVHDDTGRYVDYVQKSTEVLDSIYPDRYVAVSDQTSAMTLSTLRESGWYVQVVPKAGAANARRDVLRIGRQTQHSYFHCCDMDRILTWALNSPEELSTVKATVMAYDFVVLGRTEKAFATHPESWQATENIANHICSLELGQTVDVTAGSCGMSRSSLDHILAHSNSVVTDAEWPMIIHRIADGNIGYRAVDGLEYVEDINGPIADQADTKSWLTRLKMSYLISESAVTTSRGE